MIVGRGSDVVRYNWTDAIQMRADMPSQPQHVRNPIESSRCGGMGARMIVLATAGFLLGESSENASDQDSHGLMRQLRVLLVISYV